jgi:hypothetical protein
MGERVSSRRPVLYPEPTGRPKLLTFPFPLGRPAMSASVIVSSLDERLNLRWWAALPADQDTPPDQEPIKRGRSIER